ncbi:MAG: Coenzyme F420 hydrogenase/dehydrogenase, beta subunit C-terminal domain [Bacteroidaceae bacterium]|nr:Coenzyme F420 hydrogenase/dehydrogenase, beta subunit C-terminal domain [Bacteroidaceae bacterium]
MNNVLNIKNCFGCGVCAVVCAKKIISIKQDSEGFYAPCIVNLEQCTDCGLCTKVCAYSHKEVLDCNTTPQGYAAWSTDVVVRKNCSSGGVGFEIGRSLLDKGYKLCGVCYDVPSHKAKHYIASTLAEWQDSKGSKYIQSYTVDAFKAIDRKERWLVTGTPCQIDSFRRYLRMFNAEENFVLLDFFCHGVPSKLVWDKYIAEVEKKLGRVESVSWRSKEYGWNDSWVMKLQCDEGDIWHVSRRSQGDAFYQLFLGNQCLGKACYAHCKYKDLSSAADIRIGDLWGAAYKENEEGVSALIGLTKKGQQVIQNTDRIERTSHDMNIVLEGQMKHTLSYPCIMRPLQLFLSRTKVPIAFQALVSKYTNKLKSRLQIP